MTEFDEELLRQRVWYWLEEKKGMSVDGEVELGAGRIDLVAESSDGEIWGIEVKTGAYDKEQAHRYLETGKLDRLYIASADEIDTTDKSRLAISEISQTRKKMEAAIDSGWYTRDEAKSAIESALSDEVLSKKIGTRTLLDYVTSVIRNPKKDPITLEEAVKLVSRSVSFPELGVIHVSTVSPYDVELPDDSPDPEIIQEATYLDGDWVFEPDRREEPYVRHCVWREFGGIPEGHLPNTLDSDVPYRPIDLITFEGSPDPADAIESPGENNIIGIEAKGEGSFSRSRLSEQLTQFLKTETVSQLYLAVPQCLGPSATDFIEENPELDQVGILTVSEAGDVTTIRESTEMTPQYDGYLEKRQSRKTGYGDRFPSDSREVSSPYVTDEEAERLKHSDSIEYARELLPDRPWGDSGQHSSIEATPTESLKERTELESSGSRIHVLEGTVASDWSVENGYVELLIKYFREGDSLLLNFGRNFAGYIWFSGERIDRLMAEMSNLYNWESRSFAGRGYMETSHWKDYKHLKNYIRHTEQESEWIEQNILPDLSIEAENVADVDIPQHANTHGHKYVKTSGTSMRLSAESAASRRLSSVSNRRFPSS